MERLTFNNINEMGMYQLAHNCVFSKNGWAWYRDFDREISVIDLIKEIAKKHLIEENCIPADNETFSEIMMENLMYGTDELSGVIALLYQTMWAMVELRETLKPYEDIELTPEEIRELIKSENYWHREAIKWAGKLGEHRMKFRKLLNDFGIPECDFPDNELEQFLFSARQQDTKGDQRDE